MALPAVEPVLWPVVLAGMIYPWVVVGLAIAVSVMSSVDDPELDSWLLNGPIGILAFAAITFGLALLCARREGQRGLALASAIASAAVVVAATTPLAWAIFMPVAAGQLVVVAAIGLEVLTKVRSRLFESAESRR